MDDRPAGASPDPSESSWDLDDPDDYQMALFHGMETADLEALRRLLDLDPTQLTRFDNHYFTIPGQDTILHEAVRCSASEVVRFLIDRGADVNAHNEICAGYTPLDVAMLRRDSEIINYLLERGANPNIWTWMWITAAERSIEQLANEASDQDERRALWAVLAAAGQFPPPVYPDGTVPSFWPPSPDSPNPERVQPGER